MSSLAERLSVKYKIDIIKWKYNKVEPHEPNKNIRIINVDDVYDYYDTILKMMKNNVNLKYDMVILGAAVANLAPKYPSAEKFPSHNYKVGDTLDIPFTISPRIIDEIKKICPKINLIGFKLSNEPWEGVEELLRDSKCDLIFHHTPDNLMDMNLRTSVGKLQVCWSEFEKYVDILMNAEYRKDKWWVRNEDKRYPYLGEILQVNELIRLIRMKSNHGTVAHFDNRGWYTTNRNGRPFYFYSYVEQYTTNHNKPTMALPIFSAMAKVYNNKFFVHLHDDIANTMDLQKGQTFEYIPPNATINPEEIKSTYIYIKGHGMFIATNDLLPFIKALTDRNWEYYKDSMPERYTRDKSIEMINNIPNPRSVLEVGANDRPCKVTRDAKEKYLADPYMQYNHRDWISKGYSEIYDGSSVDLVICHNSAPFIGEIGLRNIIDRIVFDTMVMNIPTKFYLEEPRIVNATNGDVFRESSVIVKEEDKEKVIPGIVKHTLESLTSDVVIEHYYEELNEKIIHKIAKDYDLDFHTRYYGKSVYVTLSRR
jgi:hypothetical protein